jgi:glyoxylase-like metal-dependent hydrolase (beta-lactamase superfamily II)
LEVIHTPGHTVGSVSFKVIDAPLLFTGDTLFPGGPGATHFPGGNFTDIIESIDTKLFTYSPDTTILPGHGTDSLISTERPHLDEWIARGW